VQRKPYRCNLNVTGEQLRAGRAMARIEQSELAKRANVSVDTIKRLEKTVGPVSANVLTVNSIVAVLEAAGVEFTNGGQPGVRMKIYADPAEPAVLYIDGRDPVSCFTLQEAVLEFTRQPAEAQALATIQVKNGPWYGPDEIRRLHRPR